MGSNATAYFSTCRTWRYSLTREITDPQFGCLDEDERGGTVTFVGLNPSTADETADDPTIRRCVRFAREWGFDRLKMVNLYAYRATDPAVLWEAQKSGVDIVGPENDHVLSLVFGGSDRTIAAWGALAHPDRVAEIMAWPLRPRWALGFTKDRRPRHPLYVRADTLPVPF